jgi:HSP20 family protein
MRTLTLWRPYRRLPTLHNEIDSLFARLFRDEERGWSGRFDGSLVPAIESFVRGDQLVVRADLPGIDPKLVELVVEGDRLTIKGERKTEHEENGAEHLYREVGYGRFERSIMLPSDVDADSVKATYNDGVLEITTKAPKRLTSKKVPITVH